MKLYKRSGKYKKVRESCEAAFRVYPGKRLLDEKISEIDKAGADVGKLLAVYDDAIESIPKGYHADAFQSFFHGSGLGGPGAHDSAKRRLGAWKRDMSAVPEKIREMAMPMILSFDYECENTTVSGMYGSIFSDDMAVEHLSSPWIGERYGKYGFESAIRGLNNVKGKIKSALFREILERETDRDDTIRFLSSLPDNDITILSDLSDDYKSLAKNISFLENSISMSSRSLLHVAREISARGGPKTLAGVSDCLEKKLGKSMNVFAYVARGIECPNVSGKYFSAFCDLMDDKDIVKRAEILNDVYARLYNLSSRLSETTPELYKTVMKIVLGKEKSAAKITDISNAVEEAKTMGGFVDYISGIAPSKAYMLLEEVAAMGDIVPSAGAMDSILYPPLYPKLMDGVDVGRLEFYAELAGKEVKLRSSESYDVMKKEECHLRELLSRKEDACLRKRLENIEKMLSDPTNRERIAERLQREVSEKEKEYKFGAVFAAIRDSHNEFLREILDEDPEGIALTPDLSNAIKFYAACKKEGENVDACRKIIYNAVKGNGNWVLEEDANREFLAKAEKCGINTDAWIAGMEEEYVIDGEKIRVYTENDPLRSLQMGNFVEGSCLSVSGMNRSRTPANAVDINRRVVYAVNDEGVMARAVLAIDNGMNLCQGGFYKNASVEYREAGKIKERMKEFVGKFSSVCNIQARYWGTSGGIENLVSEASYDSTPCDNL